MLHLIPGTTMKHAELEVAAREGLQSYEDRHLERVYDLSDARFLTIAPAFKTKKK